MYTLNDRRFSVLIVGVVFAFGLTLAVAPSSRAEATELKAATLATQYSNSGIQPLLEAQATPSIPKGAKSYKGHYYYYFKSGIVSSWSAASRYCKSRGGHLATITSKGENDFLSRYLRSLGAENAYFGLSDSASEGNWRWVTGEKVRYTNWHDGEPNAESDDEDFAMFYWKFSDGTWNDGNFGNGTVSDDTAFICEWDYTLSLSDSFIKLHKGDKTYITYSVVGSKGNSVSMRAKWASSNTSVAKVSSKGKVVVKNPGSCTITCKVSNGLKKSVRVVVEPQKVKGVKVLSKSRSFVQLKWARQIGVSKYQVYMYDTDLEEYVRVKTVKGAHNVARIKNLSKNTKYRFKIRGVVKAWSHNYYGSFSKVRAVRTNRR